MAATPDGTAPVGRGLDDGDLAEQLAGDPAAIRAYIARRDNEVSDLRRQNAELERFRGLAVDLADSLGGAARRARQSSS